VKAVTSDNEVFLYVAGFIWPLIVWASLHSNFVVAPKDACILEQSQSGYFPFTVIKDR